MTAYATASVSRGQWTYASAVLLISVNQAVSKLMVEKLNQFVVMQVRMAVTTGLCLWALRGEPKFGPKEARRLVFFRGFLGFWGLCCTYYALKYLSLPDKATLAFLVPLATTAAAALILGEPLMGSQVVGCVFSLVGVLIVARPPILFGIVQEEHRMLSVCASLAFVAVTAAGLLVLRKLKGINPTTPVLSFALVSLVVSTALAWGHQYPTSLKTWLLLAATGVLGFSIQYLETLALKQCPASEVVNLRYTQLVWATLWEWLFWGDLPDKWSCLGGAVVLGGVWLGLRNVVAEPIEVEDQV